MIEKNIKETKPGHFKKIPLYKEEPIEGQKAIRTENLTKLTVSLDNGKIFDADEISQNRISRTIQAMEFSGVQTVTWRLADNTDSEITIDEFKEVLMKALQAQAALWFSN